jgi:ABC-type multidrug transport system fused ATPase/permease subunit
LPSTSYQFGQQVFAIISVLILISAITPWFLVAVAPITVIYFFVGSCYLACSRELKRLDSISRSPIYSHFGESLKGSSVIRSFNEKHRFIRESNIRVDENHTFFYLLWISNRWLAIRIDALGSLIIVSAALFLILSIDTIDAGFAGLSLTYALSFTDNLIVCVLLLVFFPYCDCFCLL